MIDRPMTPERWSRLVQLGEFIAEHGHRDAMRHARDVWGWNVSDRMTTFRDWYRATTTTDDGIG